MAHDTNQPASDAGELPLVTDEVRAPRLRRPPFWMISIGLVATVATWVPLVLAARARVSRSDQPRIHLIQDMGTQPKYREQQTSDVFADGRADRPRILGTVARGGLHEDDFFERGFSLVAGAGGEMQPKFFDGFPSQIELNESFLKRGQERFKIYCSVCHGLDGRGNGAVAQRSLDIAQPLSPANLTENKFSEPSNSGNGEGRTNGHIYNTINVGIRNMAGYGTQIGPEDRWAIVAYVRALQLSQNAPPSLVPDKDKASMPVPAAEAK